MSSDEVVVLIGGTNSLAKSLTDEYLKNKNVSKIIIAAKNKDKFSDLYKKYNTEILDFYELDILKQDQIPSLVKHIKECNKFVTLYYLAAVKKKGSYDIKDLFQINFFYSVFLYEELIGNIKHFNYILIGSQRDIHGANDTSSYNASKSAMSKYFEPIALKEKNNNVYLVKPWLFKSNMVKTSPITNLTLIPVDYVARKIIKNIKKNRHIIYIPSITYKFVELISLLNKRILYFLLFRFIKS